MILDDDNTVVENIDKIELSPDILKKLGWKIKYNTSGETAYTHDNCNETSVILRYYHYRSNGYYSLWWKFTDVYCSMPVTYVGELHKKLNTITEFKKLKKER